MSRRLIAVASFIDGEFRLRGPVEVAAALITGRLQRVLDDEAARDSAGNRQALRELVRRP